jgi:hypothetical protein
LFLIAQNPPEPFAIVGNTFSANTATSLYAGEQGGAIAVLPFSSSATIGNNIMALNSSGIYRRTGLTASPALVRNDLYNGAANYVGIPAGATDLLTDPLFVDRPGGDYRLQETSPLVDVGDPGCVETTTDLGGTLGASSLHTPRTGCD